METVQIIDANKKLVRLKQLKWEISKANEFIAAKKDLTGGEVEVYAYGYSLKHYCSVDLSQEIFNRVLSEMEKEAEQLKGELNSL